MSGPLCWASRREAPCSMSVKSVLFVVLDGLAMWPGRMNHILKPSKPLLQGLLLLCNAEFMARYPGASTHSEPIQMSVAASGFCGFRVHLPGRTASIAIYVAAEDCSVGCKQALRCRFCTWVLELQVIVCFCADCNSPTAFAKHEGSRGYCPSGS